MNSYFSHDSNARNDEKIAKLRMKYGAAGYGVYFMILERLREASDYMSIKDYNVIAFDLREDSQLIKSVVEDFGLFAFTKDENRGECFYSESFNDRMALKDEKTKRRAEAGKKGAAKRWNKNDKAMSNEKDSNAIAKPSKNIASKVKESKVNKSKENNNIDGGENPLDLWTTLWGFPNAVAMSDFSDWREEFGNDLMLYVIKYAAQSNVQAKGALRYLERVFDGWRQQGIKTVEEAKRATEEHNQRMANARGATGRTNIHEELPGWAQDEPEPEPEPEYTPEQLAVQKMVAEQVEIDKERERNG